MDTAAGLTATVLGTLLASWLYHRIASGRDDDSTLTVNIRNELRVFINDVEVSVDRGEC